MSTNISTSKSTQTISISPVTRIEGHLDIRAVVDDGKVAEAFSSGTTFRGFEFLLRGRAPRDATHYTQRICGVCPVSHGMASAKTLESAFGITPLPNGRILRNLVLGANFLQSHILHFYHLALLDYVDPAGHPVLNKAPWKPGYWSEDLLSVEDPVTRDLATQLLANYVEALSIRRKTHQMGAIFGGKLPCTPVFVPSGCTESVTQEKKDAFLTLLEEITTFIALQYLNDVQSLSQRFPDYHDIGVGCGNLLAFGVFDTGNRFHLSPGTYTSSDDQVGTFDPDIIGEDLTFSYYDELSGDPAVGKPGAYSWIKAPRYNDTVFEVGPLARMKISGRYEGNKDYQGNISVMDRLLARAEESLDVALGMAEWVDALEPGQPTHEWKSTSIDGSGIGLTEAPRGALGHWLKVADSKIDGYQIITPTAWNASPHDDQERPGPIEQALIGTSVRDSANPIELLRVVHSFDPCLACSVHTIHPRQVEKKPLWS